jgi:lactate dehydrogenase-like 2-hydroxyacid dehydrogenase
MGSLPLADGASAMLVTPTDGPVPALFKRISLSAKILVSRSVGYDRIDVADRARAHVAVSNAPSVLTDAVADTALLLLLGASASSV